MKLKYLAILLASALVSGSTLADPPKTSADLNGEWLVTGGTIDGKPVPEKEVKRKVIVTFADGKLSMTEAGKADKVEQVYKADSTNEPKTIDITPETAERGLVRGIYKIEGNILKICVGEPGKGRPTKFEAPSGSGHSLMELKRMKK